ncbi:MAG: DUF1080 domain-containing protein [Verrucomicrobiota bacterium]
MKTKTWWVVAVSASCGMANGEIHGYPDGPKLPGGKYSVHDPARPQPPVVATAGAVVVKPPADAVVLFDGKSLDAWSPGWKIEDGSMVASGKDIESKQAFGAIQMHFEWRLPAGRKVDGQSGGNSGVFLMGRYEVQVLQSNANPTYPDGQAGSMYGQRPPLVNATAPQGEWNSYDLTFVPPVYQDGKVVAPAKLTLFHNGVCVQNGEAYLGPTEHQKLASYPASHPETGPLKLQFHGDPMEYRNMWVRPLGEIAP